METPRSLATIVIRRISVIRTRRSGEKVFSAARSAFESRAFAMTPMVAAVAGFIKAGALKIMLKEDASVWPGVNAFSVGVD